MSETPEKSNPDIARRTVMKTAAWSVPVIAMASAVPAYAASTPDAPTCTPSTVNSLASWGVNTSWPASANSNCGPHADVVFIFQAGQACGATQLEIVVGLPGANDTTNRGAIWLWSTPTANYRAQYGYILNTGSAATVSGGIAIPAGGIAVPKYKSGTVTAGYREAHNGDNVVNDGIHVAIYNDTNGNSGGGCQKVNTVSFTWFWRATAPVAGPWHMMTSTLSIGATVGDITLNPPVYVGEVVSPGAYTSIA